MIDLPVSPAPSAVAWELVDFGGTLQGPLGGAAQRVNRLGGRWRCEVALPPMKSAQAREWAVTLARALREGARWKIVQADLQPGSPGTTLVNGASQSGDSIAIDGFTANYTLRIGQFFSILTSSQRYVYQAAASGRANSSGQLTVEIEPPLRVEPADNDTVEMGVPYVEGLLQVPPSLTLDADRIARGVTFSILEAR